jgi:hypothetical protein
MMIATAARSHGIDVRITHIDVNIFNIDVRPRSSPRKLRVISRFRTKRRSRRTIFARRDDVR